MGRLTQVNDRKYAIYTLEPQNCEDIIVSDDDIRLFSFDCYQFADTLLNKLIGLPLTKSVQLVFNHSLTYHLAEYFENDEFSRALYVYFSLLPKELDNLDLSYLFSQHNDFVVLTIGKPYADLTTAANPFSSRLITIDGLLGNDITDRQGLNLTKRFSDILSNPIVRILSEQVVKDSETGRNERLKQQQLGQLRAKDIKHSAVLRKQEIQNIALPFVEKKPHHYSATSLARIIKPKLSFTQSERTIRKTLTGNSDIKQLLKSHHRNKD